MPDEKTAVNSSYLITFLNDVELLLDYAGAYMNIIVNLNAKYSGSESIELTASENEALTGTVNALRSLILKTYIRLKALNLKEQKIKKQLTELESLYKDIKETPILELEKVEKYTMLLNEIFLNSVALNKMIESSKNELEGLAK